MASAYSRASAHRARPRLGGSLLFLLMNLPLGIAGFVVLTALTTTGLATAICWVGVPLLALLLIGVRAAARVERDRVRTLLGTYVASPYRPLPQTTRTARWKARVSEGATWRDYAYFLLLFPIGIAEFVVIVVSWGTSLALTTMPIYFRYLPDETFIFPSDGHRWAIIDSTIDALPWAALGLLCLAVSVTLTRVLGALHAHFARLLLGPGRHARRLVESEFSDTENVGAVV